MLTRLSSSAAMDDMGVLNRYARAGDPGAFEVLVLRYQGMVLATCRRILRTEADAEDAAQETFLKLARRAGSVRSNAAAWLHACAVRTSLDLARRESSRSRAEAGAGAASGERVAEPTWREIEPVLDAALEKLCDDQRDLIVRRFLAGRPQHTLAAEAGISEGSMSRRMDRALAALRRELSACGCAAGATLPAVLEQAPVPAGSPALTGSLVKTGLSCIGHAPAPGLLGSMSTAAAVAGIGLLTLGGGAAVLYSSGHLKAAIASVSEPERRYQLTGSLRDGLPSTRVECDGASLTMQAFGEGAMRGIMRVELLRPSAKPGTVIVRIKELAIEGPSEFDGIGEREVELRFTRDGDRITLRLVWGDGPNEATNHWVGLRAAGAAEPKAVSGAPAPDLAGVWHEVSGWELRLTKDEIRIRQDQLVIYKFKVLAWHDGADLDRVEVICVQSVEPGMVGQRAKLLVRESEAGCEIAVHAPDSPKLNEYPETFAAVPGDNVMVMSWRKEVR